LVARMVGSTVVESDALRAAPKAAQSVVQWVDESGAQ
jgi:hypothetical protein